MVRQIRRAHFLGIDLLGHTCVVLVTLGRRKVVAVEFVVAQSTCGVLGDEAARIFGGLGFRLCHVGAHVNAWSYGRVSGGGARPREARELAVIVTPWALRNDQRLQPKCCAARC